MSEPEKIQQHTADPDKQTAASNSVGGSITQRESQPKAVDHQDNARKKQDGAEKDSDDIPGDSQTDSRNKDDGTGTQAAARTDSKDPAEDELDQPHHTIVSTRKDPPEKESENDSGSDDKDAPEQQENGRENQVVHTRSVSIKDVLRGTPKKIPVIDDEIDESDQVAKGEEIEEAPVQFTEEDVQRVWSDYAASIEKVHPRIYTTLKQHKPTLNERGAINVQLNTNAQRENFIQHIKSGLVKYLQENLADIEYVFETNLIENETTVKKLYTDQDKLDYLIRKNPDLEKLKSKFNLDFDN